MPLGTSEFGLVSRALPQPTVDNQEREVRLGRYGETCVYNVVPKMHAASDEGSYFAITTPTPGTKVDYGSAGTQTSFSDTVPFMLIKNNDALGGKRIYLDYLKLIQIGGTAPASTTSVQMAVKIDNINRQNTAGTLTTLTPVSANMDSGLVSIGQWFIPAGAVATIPGGTSAAMGTTEVTKPPGWSRARCRTRCRSSATGPTR